MAGPPCILTTSEDGWSADMGRIMKARALRYGLMTSCMVSKKTTEVNPKALQQLRAIFGKGYARPSPARGDNIPVARAFLVRGAAGAQRGTSVRCR